MELTAEHVLFYIEFGEPTGVNSGWFSFGGDSIKPVFVIAKSFHEAAKKAMAHIDQQESSKKSVVDSLGDLRIPSDCVKINQIKVVSENIIF